MTLSMTLRSIVLAVLLVGTLTVPSVVVTVNATQQQDISVNPVAYYASIPSHMTVGQNYTIRVLVSNNGPNAQPLIVTLNTPTGFMVANPLEQDVVLTPSDSITLLFYIVPYESHQGILNVTMNLFVANGSSTHTPLLIESLSAQVYSISRSAAPTIIVLSVIVVAFAVGSFLVLRRRRSERE